MILRFYQNNKVILDKCVKALVFAVAAYFCVTQVLGLVAPFVIAFIVSAALEPLVSLLKKRFKIPRGLSAVVLIVVTITFFVVLLTFLGGRVVDQAKQYVENLPEYIDRFTVLFEGIKGLIPEILGNALEESGAGILSTLTSSLSTGAGRSGLNIVKSLPSAVIFFVITIISSFFLTKDKVLITNALKSLIPENIARIYGEIKQSIGRALWGYVKAQLIIMTFSTSVSIIGLAIMRYPFALFVGISIALVDAIPGIGSGAVFWPWALYRAVNGDYKFAIGLMIIYGIVFLCRQFLEPKILSTQIGIHPLLILMSLYVGIKLFGGLGIVLGPILAVSFKIIWTRKP